jgi:polyphosphate kinase
MNLRPKLYTDVTYLPVSKFWKTLWEFLSFFDINYRVHRYKHLIVSPHYTRTRFVKLIDREITHALAGRKTYKAKMNSLSDFGMIDKLYEASRQE